MGTRQQFCNPLDSITPELLRELKLAARRKLRDGEDALQEAFLRTLAGTRVLRDGITLKWHILRSAQSISSSWRKGAQDIRLVCELSDPEQGGKDPMDKLAEPASQNLSVEAAEMLRAIETLFQKDRVALQTIRLMGLGLTGKEIQAALAMSVEEYAAVVRRIRRKLEKHFPERFRCRAKRARSLVTDSVRGDQVAGSVC
jgi:DNA-directed RNA polymerase specialized sigma24 family protein